VPFQNVVEEKEERPELLMYMDIFIFLLKYKIGLILNVKNKLLNIKKKNIIAFKNLHVIIPMIKIVEYLNPNDNKKSRIY
jgi:hypothetical protein